MNNKERQYIKRVIQEEYLSFMKEVGLCHNKNTGHFDKCSPGNTYSLSDRGAKSAGVDSKYVKRGTLTKTKSKGDVPVTRAYFGLNSNNKSGGRIKITSGDKISPKLSVSKYPKPYKEGLKEASLAMAQWVASSGSQCQLGVHTKLRAIQEGRLIRNISLYTHRLEVYSIRALLNI